VRPERERDALKVGEGARQGAVGGIAL
jgi:hypothetical protein